MTSEKRIWLHQTFNRLCFHVGLAPEEHATARVRFIASLLCYPEDLLSAAYHHVVRHITPPYYPNEGDFILFMTPEYMRRQQVQCMEDA